MEELTNEIRLRNAYPVTDEVGENTKPFRFKLTNTCGVGVDYNLNLEVMGLVDEKSESNPNGKENRIAAKNIAVKVDENNKSILNSNQSATPTYKEDDYTAVESYTVFSGSIKPYENVTHEVRIWLDESADNDSQNGKFYSKVVIEAKQNQVAAQNFASIVQLGAYVEMTPTSTSYTISKSLTGYSSDQIINPSELNLWRVINKNDDGAIEMVSEYTSSTLVYFTGVTGYNNYAKVLQSIAEQYANSNYTVATRHFGYNGQTLTTPTPTISICGTGYGCLDDSKETLGCGEEWYKKDFNLVQTAIGSVKTLALGSNSFVSYWNTSKTYYGGGPSNALSLWGSYVTETGEIVSASWSANSWLYNIYDNSNQPDTQSVGRHIRPIITLNPNQKVTGDGSLDDPYVLH